MGPLLLGQSPVKSNPAREEGAVRILIPPARLEGTIRVPGDKSISHRAVILNSIADGQARIAHFLAGADCISTINCMRAMGVSIEEGEHVGVEGRGAGPSRPSRAGSSPGCREFRNDHASTDRSPGGSALLCRHYGRQLAAAPA